MDEQSRPRRGRPRAAIPVAETDKQIGSDIAQESGNGPASEAGTEVSTDVVGTSKASNGLVSFEELSEIARNEWRQVVRIWHPEAKDSLILHKNGSGIEVLKGDAAYQLTTGEVVEV